MGGELLHEAKSNEQAIRFPDEREVCALIAEESPTLREMLRTAEDTKSFLASCLTLRGAFQDGKRRRLAREQARLLGYLADGAPIPVSTEDFLALWETANRLEPRWYDDLPAHFRTADEHTPFAHGKNPLLPGPVLPGFETSPPEEIPEAVSSLLEWVHRPDLPRELAAFATHFLAVRIHPFPDGNGHTARLLCCGLLAPDYSAATLTAFLEQMNENRHSVTGAVRLSELSTDDLCLGCCTLLRLLIRGQKRLLSREIRTAHAK